MTTKYQSALSRFRNVGEPTPTLDDVLLAIDECNELVSVNQSGELFYPYQMRSFEALETQGLIRSEITRVVNPQGRHLLVKLVPTAKGRERAAELKLAAA
jgi:hypothetical protein